MASGVTSVLTIGTGALFASQTAIQTTGNNIANVNTLGYSRQAVRLEEWPSLDYSPGQMGQGVVAAEVYRYFDKFIERSYLNTSSDESRWSAQYTQLQNVEGLFNEANTSGLSAAMQDFFTAWDKVSQWPEDQAAREALLGKAQTLSDITKNTDQGITSIVESVNDQLGAQVERANTLMQEIADLNKSINAHVIPGKNNPNAMLDERDRKVRELAALIDVDVIDKGNGDYIVNTKSGYTLVDAGVAFSLEMRGAGVEKKLVPTSAFDGNIQSSGADGYEYTVEIVQGGNIATTTPPGAGDATFRVSLDGGRTWLTGDDGSELHFNAYDSDNKVQVKDLEISFEGTTALSAGDKFTVTPKSSIYWVSPTIGPINISPQMLSDGTLNTRRMTGGAMAGNLIFRDYQAEEFRDKLDSFAKSLIYEVNKIHSQGAGLTGMTNALGDYQASRTDVPLGLQNSGFSYSEKLQPGNFAFAFYDATTGKAVLPDPGIENAFSVNYNPDDTTGTPPAGSLEGIVASINSNASLNPYIQANIVDNRLQITSKPGYTFAVADDTTGVLAALGINTFFKGDSAGNLELTESVVQDRNRINAGKVNGGAEFNSGDNQSAIELAKLSSTLVKFNSWNEKTTSQTMNNYYASLVSDVGAAVGGAKFSYAVEKTKAQELDDRQSEVAGVNLDEEMSNLIKFQASYKAAAKLITTADQMLQTLLSLKQ